jgi:cobalt-zinc-cadmium efflux system outer membrane protein
MDRNALLVWLFLFLFAPAANGQDTLITIQDAVKSAMVRNAGLQQLNAQYRQKAGAWRSETGIQPPEISYFKEGIGSGPGDVFDEKRITVTQEITSPLATAYHLKGLSEELKSMEYQILAREKEIRAEVKSHYIGVIYALRLRASRLNQLRIMGELDAAVRAKFATGMANGIDLANVELQLEEARNDLDQSEWTLHKARYSLFHAMGMPVDEQRYSIQFTDTLFAPDIRIDEIYALTHQEVQPTFLATRHDLNAAGYFLKEAKSQLFPDMRLSLYRQDLGTGYDFRGFEVGIRIPLWLPLDYKGKISQSLARKEEVEWRQNEVKLDMKQQIEHAWHNYEVSRSIVNRYTGTMRSKAELLQKLGLRAYQLGEIDLLHYLNAQQAYISSEQRYLEAMRDYYLQLVILEKFLGEELVK